MSAMKVRSGFRTALWLALVVCSFTVAAAVAAKEPVSGPGVIKLAQHRSEDRSASETRDSSTAKSTPPASSETTTAAVVYQPPRRGAPSVNVGAGGVRGGFAQARPLALAPDHVGLTLHANPSLFWYIDTSPRPDLEVLFTLIEADGIEPLVERKLASPKRAGIQRVRLGSFGVKLRPGVLYEWSIALVSSDAMQPQVAVTTGFIRRVPSESTQLGDARDGAAYAQAGLWYDAMGAFGDAIAAQPDDTNLRSMRNSLLRQAKLDTAVE
jgi:hypothetical protein